MKALLMLLLVLFVLSASAQKEIIPPTETFRIEGEVKIGLTVTLSDLSSYTVYSIDSIVITNHLGEKRNTLKNVKAVLLKDILAKVEIAAESPKLLSEYYLVLIASDNYKVVFSWNEIFNSETGKSVYIMTGHDGKTASALDDRIALISPKDLATGRRYVKGLQRIVIGRVQ